MSLGEHLEELRMRIIRAIVGLVLGTCACLYFAPSIIAALKQPYVAVMTAHGLEPDLAILDVTAGLTIYLKVSLYAGLILSSPWIFYQLWMFLAAGLYEREKRYVHLAVPLSAGLFVGGASFFLLVVSKPILYFFIGVSKWLGVKPIITFSNHITFMTRFMVVFGLGFQTPVLVLLLGMIGVVTTKTLNHYRRHVIVLMFIIAAFCTSPSPIDQIAMAIPMWLLYELGVLLVYLTERKKNR